MVTTAPTGATNSLQVLSVSYRSSSNAAFTYTQTIPTPLAASASDKTAYLATLREAAVTMQDKVNAELTARMEEDKALEAASKSGAAKTTRVDEAKEEDNYGEEVAEED